MGVRFALKPQSYGFEAQAQGLAQTTCASPLNCAVFDLAVWAKLQGFETAAGSEQTVVIMSNKVRLGFGVCA